MTELSFIIYKHIYIRKNIDKKLHIYWTEYHKQNYHLLSINTHIYICTKKKYRSNKCKFTWQSLTELSFLKILHFTFLARWFSRRRFLNVVTVFVLCRYDLPLETCSFIWPKFPVHKDILYQVWSKLAKWFWKRKMNVWKVYNDEYDREWKKVRSEKKKN